MNVQTMIHAAEEFFLLHTLQGHVPTYCPRSTAVARRQGQRHCSQSSGDVTDYPHTDVERGISNLLTSVSNAVVPWLLVRSNEKMATPLAPATSARSPADTSPFPGMPHLQWNKSMIRHLLLIGKYLFSSSYAYKSCHLR